MSLSTRIADRFSRLRYKPNDWSRWMPLLSGVVLTAAAIMMARSRIEAARIDLIDKARPIDIVVAAKPIHDGDAFTASNVARKSIPVSGTGKRNIPASEFNLLLNAKSKGEIEPGEPILWTDVDEPFETEGFSLSISRGKRAITLEADITASFAGLLRTGDHVDILCKPSNEWIRDVPVLAINRQYNRSGDREQEEVATVTLSVTRDEGARLSGGSRDGKLLWFLRNPNDNLAAPACKISRNHPKAVEVWKGGIPESNGMPIAWGK